MIAGGLRVTPVYRPCGTCLVNIAVHPHEPGGQTCRELSAERTARFHPLGHHPD